MGVSGKFVMEAGRKSARKSVRKKSAMARIAQHMAALAALQGDTDQAMNGSAGLAHGF
jgi:hypothetical protein